MKSVTTKNAEGLKVAVDKYAYNNIGDIKSIETTAFNADGTVLATVNNKYNLNREAKPTASVTENGLLITFAKNSDSETPTLLLKNGESGSIIGHTFLLKETKNGNNVETKYSRTGKITKYSGINTEATEAKPAQENTKKTVAINDLFDLKGNKIGKIKLTTENGTLTSQEYDANGQIVKKIVKNAHGEEVETTYEYNKNSSEKTRTVTEIHKLADGVIRAEIKKSETAVNNKGKDKYAQIGDGAIQRTVYHYKGDVLKRCTYNFDSNGYKTAENIVTTYLENGQYKYKLTECRYEYNKNADSNVEAKRTETLYTDKDLKNLAWRENYKYDKSSNRVGCVRTYADGTQKTYKIDLNGNRTLV